MTPPPFQDLTLDKAMIARDLLGECDLPADCDGEPAAKRPCRAPPEPPLPLPLAEDPCDELSWRKSVSVGAAHQAELPPLRPPSGRRRAARPGDRLLWDPSRLPEPEVERFQRRLRPTVVSAAAPAYRPPPRHLPDHEQVRPVPSRTGGRLWIRGSSG